MSVWPVRNVMTSVTDAHWTKCFSFIFIHSLWYFDWINCTKIDWVATMGWRANVLARVDASMIKAESVDIDWDFAQWNFNETWNVHHQHFVVVITVKRMRLGNYATQENRRNKKRILLFPHRQYLRLYCASFDGCVRKICDNNAIATTVFHCFSWIFAIRNVVIFILGSLYRICHFSSKHKYFSFGVERMIQKKK